MNHRMRFLLRFFFVRLAQSLAQTVAVVGDVAESSKLFAGTSYRLGYWNEYPAASFPEMNLVLYSSK